MNQRQVPEARRTLHGRQLFAIGLLLSIAIAVWAAVACRRSAVAASTGDSPAAVPDFDLAGAKGETVFLILGWLDEYQGRHALDGDDMLEGFYCNEQEKARLFRRHLDRLMQEQGLHVEVREVRVQDCLIRFHSFALASAMNRLFVTRRGPLSWVQDQSGRRRGIEDLFASRDMFQHVGRAEELAYLAGAYERWGTENRFRFANASHKANLIAQLLRELGATDVAQESTQGRIPQTNTIRFVPTPELQASLTRQW